MVNKVCGAARGHGGGHGGGHFDETLNWLTRDCNRGHELVESPEVVISGREFGVTCVPEMHGSCV